MSVFDENIIKKDLSLRIVLEQEVSRVVEDVYHDIQYRINNGQTIFKLYSKEYICGDIETTSDIRETFIDWLYRELEKLKEHLSISPIKWDGANGAKLNIINISLFLMKSKEEKNVVDIFVDYKIINMKGVRSISPSILDMGCMSYQYIFEEFERPLERPSILNSSL